MNVMPKTEGEARTVTIVSFVLMVFGAVAPNPTMAVIGLLGLGFGVISWVSAARGQRRDVEK